MSDPVRDAWEDRILEILVDRLGVLYLTEVQKEFLRTEGWETAWDLGTPPEEVADQIMEGIPRW
jgi:hypothetical protein